MRFGLTMLRGGLVAALIAVALPATCGGRDERCCPGRCPDRLLDRRRGKPPRRGGDDPHLLQARTRRPDRQRQHQRRACARSMRPACSRTCASTRPVAGWSSPSSRTRSSAASFSKATRRSRTSSSRPKCSRSRAARLSRPMVQSDTQRITEIYRRQGRYDVTVVPQIIEQPNNRVDLVFEITEGGKTGVKSIEFVGNSACLVVPPARRHQDPRDQHSELPAAPPTSMIRTASRPTAT